MPDIQVTVVEVGPRDGLQNESVLVTTDAKLRYIELAIAAGVTRIEAVSFVRPDAVPQMADAEAVMAGVPRVDGVSYAGLVLNHRGFVRAKESGVDEIDVVIAASDTFNRRNQNATTEALTDMVGEVVSSSRNLGVPATVTIATAFGCPFEGEVPLDAVSRIARTAYEAGAVEIAMADTIGVAVPVQVSRLARAVGDVAPGAPLRMHFHNTRNTGYANAVAAINSGVRVLDASIGGIGGCPFAPRATGNIATEDLVYLLDRSGIRTGLELERLCEGAEFIGRQLGKEVPSMLPKAGGFPPGAAS